MIRGSWKTAGIVLLAVALGVALGGGGLLDRAEAQTQGEAGGVIAVMGEQLRGDAPLVLVDTREESIMVYDYSYSRNTIELTSARSYRWDKRLEDWETRGPSVDEVRTRVEEGPVPEEPRRPPPGW